MFEKKITLPSLRNQNWKNIKAESEKKKKKTNYYHISERAITQLNELINAGAKFVYNKIGVSLKNRNRNLKAWIKKN